MEIIHPCFPSKNRCPWHNSTKVGLINVHHHHYFRTPIKRASYIVFRKTTLVPTSKWSTLEAATNTTKLWVYLVKLTLRCIVRIQLTTTKFFWCGIKVWQDKRENRYDKKSSISAKSLIQLGSITPRKTIWLWCTFSPKKKCLASSATILNTLTKEIRAANFSTVVKFLYLGLRS